MKQLLLTIMLFCTVSYASAQQTVVNGVVTSQLSGEPLAGVNVIIKGTSKGVVTDAEGMYNILCKQGDVLLFTYIGYEPEEAVVGEQGTIDIALTEGLEMLSAVEVYATGYQEISPERATGSFAQVGQELVNRATSTDIISRIENITPGLLFDKRMAGDTYGDDFRALRIRGVNSIEADNSPLIVVDNFPYEGDINNINPNDVEQITVLKDAAAASIWGARAANGVIVITTKKGTFNKPFEVSVSSNITISEKPDLHYSPDYLPSQEFIAFEREMFERGFYNSRENSVFMSPLSPVVELLIQERDGQLSATELEAQLAYLGQQDVRDEAEDHFFRNSLKQQHAINMRGGTSKAQYYLSGGFDKDLSAIDGNSLDRVTLVSNNSFRPIDALELNLGVSYTTKSQHNNGIGWGTVATRFPYTTFTDTDGNFSPVVNDYRQAYINDAEAQGLLDWQYRPLQEKTLRNNILNGEELRINTGLKFTLSKDLNFDVKYQYQHIGSTERNLQDKDAYHVRNLVNRFTQADGTRIFPYGDVLREIYSNQEAHSGRAQLNYTRQSGNAHHFSGIAGAEVRQVRSIRGGYQVFGYNDDALTFQNNLDYTTRYPVRPRGTTFLPRPSIVMGDLTDRYISYFGNASYTYNGKYIISASARWDASNLFGVKTNQKGVPLWSVGGSWDISEEDFYSIAALPYLRLRATYGYNGNIDKSLTAFPTARYLTDFYTSLPALAVRTPGNPQLRWEKVGIINLGLDFESRGGRIRGQLEWYSKHGRDIIAEAPVDPTTGFISEANVQNKLNSAETRTRGIDLQLTTINIDRKISWTTTFFLSSAKSKVLDFYNESIGINTIFAGIGSNVSILPQEGQPIDGLYSLPWHGLDPANGDPLVYYDEQTSTDYLDYLINFKFEDLVYHGENVAPVYGSIRNDISWKGFTISANISYKAGHYFRRSSISYTNLMNNWAGHKDFVQRWQKPGDELVTQVPSIPSSPNNYRDVIYHGSELMVEKGDHIRLEDINLNYTFGEGAASFLKIQNLRVFVYARNLGILWRANKLGLDPDYPTASYTPPRNISFGFNATI